MSVFCSFLMLLHVSISSLGIGNEILILSFCLHLLARIILYGSASVIYYLIYYLMYSLGRKGRVKA